MPIRDSGPFPFGEFLKRLREKKGATLKQVEDATGLSNAYISQLETGTRRRLPTPEKLKALADYLNVTVQELLEKAGYTEPDETTETYEQKIERVFNHIITDPKFKFGTRLATEKYDIDAKRFIIEMYEQATGRKLLNNAT